MAVTKSFSDTLLSSIFSNAYIGLSTTQPSVDGTGVTEPSASAGYKRVAASGGSFVSNNGMISNTNYIYFPEATSSWGTVTHICVFSGTGSSAQLRYFGELSPQKEIGINSVPLFRPQSINVSLVEGA